MGVPPVDAYATVCVIIQDIVPCVVQVYNFMENCLLPKFRKSAEYQELLRSIETERKATPAYVPTPTL